MKKIQLSFFWRLFAAFVSCSIVPLFLLSVVFTSVSQYVMRKSNLQRAQNTVESCSLAMESLITNAFYTAQKAADSYSIIRWCGGTDDKLENSRLVSDIFQQNAILQETGDYELFIVRLPLDGGSAISKNKGETLSQSIIPEQYKTDSYNTWGLLSAMRLSSDKQVLFTQPHPDSGNKASLAAAVPVYENSGRIIGLVIIDILRDAIEARINDRNALSNLFIYDKNLCIVYSLFSSDKESSFWDENDFSEQNIPLITKTDNAPGKQIKVPVEKVYCTISAYGMNFCGFLPASVLNQYVHDFRQTALLIGFASGLAVLAVSVFLTRSIAHPVQMLAKAMEKAESGDLTVRCREPANSRWNDEMTFLVRRFNIMVERFGRLMDDRMERQRLLRIAEVKALQAQISPHFLYNTLNSIKSMAKLAGANNVAKSVTSLGKLLRSGFTPGDDFCSVADSIELVQNYFDIETARWEDRFTFICEVDSSIMDFQIPRLVIQPLAENAIVHGLEQKEGSGALTIRGMLVDSSHRQEILDNNSDKNFDNNSNKDGFNSDGRTNDYDVCIQVADDGCGMSKIRLQELRNAIEENSKSSSVSSEIGSNGIAIVNTNRRLRLLYGYPYGLTVQSDMDKGTVITILIPYVNRINHIGEKQND